MPTYTWLVAYYERWSGKLAASLYGWTEVGDVTPIIADQPSARDWTPVRQWVRWTPQPEYGWTPAGDQPPAPQNEGGPDLVHIAFYERWGAPGAFLGWAAAGDAGADAPPSWVPIKAWTRWLPQPEYGWTPAGDAGAVPIVDTPTPQSLVRPWSRWLPQPQFGWVPATDIPPVQIVDTPPGSPSIRPWPRGFILQPWYGWAQASDQDQATAPGWAPPVVWTARWTRQPGLGWVQAGDTGVIPLVDTPLAPWLHPFLFAMYRLQPNLGWSAPTDLPPALPAVFTITRRRVRT
jgi:hypothetical protein